VAAAEMSAAAARGVAGPSGRGGRAERARRRRVRRRRRERWWNDGAGACWKGAGAGVNVRCGVTTGDDGNARGGGL